MARTNFFVLLALLIALVPVVAADEAKQARIIDRLAKKQADVRFPPEEIRSTFPFFPRSFPTRTTTSSSFLM